MKEILFKNENALVEKNVDEISDRKFVNLSLLDENGNVQLTVALKEPKDEKIENK